MVRYKTDHKETTRKKILKTAGRLFREHGYEGLGIDAIMQAAGLTAGGFYAHFDSKEALFDEAMAESARGPRKEIYEDLCRDGTDGEWLLGITRAYLSRTHRDHPQEGCPLAALASEVSKGSKRMKSSVERELRKSMDVLEKRMPASATQGLTEKERVLGLLSVFIGGVIMSRAVESPDLSEAILKAARKVAVPEHYGKGPSNGL